MLKKFLPPLCLVFALASNSLLAQDASDTSANIGSSSSEVRHVGARFIPCPVPAADPAPCAIGSQEAPVSAGEYTAFLNTMASDDHSWYFSDYYESAYMVTDQDWLSSPNATIQRTSKGSCYQYSVMPGHETDIIDSVTLADIRDEFNDWRRNPTIQEICDYINDKAVGLDGEAEAIKKCYAENSQSIWEQADLMGQVSGDLQHSLQSEVCDEQDTPLLNFSNRSNNELLHAEIIEGMEYYRPSALSWEKI